MASNKMRGLVLVGRYKKEIEPIFADKVSRK